MSDIAKTSEDFEQCKALIEKHTPTSMIPEFGSPLNATMVIRDGDDPKKIVGLIHVETAHEVRSFIIDPSYKYQEISSVVLYNAMEMGLRVQGVDHYYFGVDRDQSKIIKLYERMGATLIDPNVVRFVKRL